MTTPRRPYRNALHRRPAWFSPCVAAVVSGMVALSPPQPGEDENEFRRHSVEISVRENCLICHSEELITSSRLTPKQWKTEVEKMVGWGSPVPEDQQQPMIDYLSAEYPAELPARRLVRMSYKEAVGLVSIDPPNAQSRGDAARGGSVYLKNCANCHGTEGRGAELGPNLVEKPVLWRKTDYQEVVRRGRGRMPGFATLLDETAQSDLLAWLRSRRFRSIVAGLN